jgi:uncharacterized protein (TIGR01777 family)
MAKIAIAGGTGLVGTELSHLLSRQGHEVVHLSRRENLQATFPAYQWDLEKHWIDPKALEGTSILINLAGAGIADGRWTPERKQLIISSRVESARTLKKAIEDRPGQFQAYLSASAIGYYGDREDQLLSEESAPGRGFLAKSTGAWEEAIQEVAETGIRTVAFRIGIVLSPLGGALEKMLQPLQFRISGYFGNGRQWYSWIHIEDLARMFAHALEQPSLEGIYNGVSPSPVTNYEFAKVLADVKGGPVLVAPVPAFALRIVFGEMADTILSSAKVSHKSIAATGFTYNYPTLPEALEALLG